MGRLYQVDMRLRPTGKSGSLVIPLCEFRRYYGPAGAAQAGAERSCGSAGADRARVVYGDPDFGGEVMAAVAQAAFGPPWRPELVDEIVGHARAAGGQSQPGAT